MLWKAGEAGQGLWIQREPSECVGTGSCASFLSAPSPGRAVFQEELGIPHAGPGSSAAVLEQAAGCVEYCGHGFVNCLWRCSRRGGRSLSSSARKPTTRTGFCEHEMVEHVRRSWTIPFSRWWLAASCRPLDVASSEWTPTCRTGHQWSCKRLPARRQSQEPNFQRESQPERLSARRLWTSCGELDVNAHACGPADWQGGVAIITRFRARDSSEADAYWRTPGTSGLQFLCARQLRKGTIVVSLSWIGAPALTPCTAHFCVNLRGSLQARGSLGRRCNDRRCDPTSKRTASELDEICATRRTMVASTNVHPA
mmetsp:Transcript_9767/g.27235  ORF Transcript_9767/g.27235 Transcript_9767/m.27235 type:complete len:312 (-) Transcript_9767:36-971(-)